MAHELLMIPYGNHESSKQKPPQCRAFRLSIETLHWAGSTLHLSFWKFHNWENPTKSDGWMENFDDPLASFVKTKRLPWCEHELSKVEFSKSLRRF